MSRTWSGSTVHLKTNQFYASLEINRIQKQTDVCICFLKLRIYCHNSYSCLITELTATRMPPATLNTSTTETQMSILIKSAQENAS